MSGTKESRKFQTLMAEARRQQELAAIYLDDGALHTGAERLREAADIYEQAVAIRDAVLGAQPKEKRP